MMSSRSASFLARAVRASLVDSVGELEDRVHALSRRARRVERAIVNVAQHQAVLDEQLLLLPQFSRVQRETYEEAIAEFASIQTELRPILAQLRRLKDMDLDPDRVAALAQQATALATLTAHNPKKPKSMGSILASLRSAFFHPSSDGRDDAGSSSSSGNGGESGEMGDNDEPAYMVVAAWGHTNGSIKDLGLGGFQDLEDRLGLITAGSLRAAGIHSRSDFDAYVSAWLESPDSSSSSS